MHKLMIIIAAAAALAASRAVAAATNDPKPQAGQFDLREWIVFICDPSQERANHGLFASTLPEFAAGSRAAAPASDANRASPVGVIRLLGGGDDKVDVLLRVKQGEFLASWPPAEKKSDRLLWSNLGLTQQPGNLQPVEAAHWFNALRQEKSDWLLAKNQSERFLLYDAEFSSAIPLRLWGGEDGTYRAADSLNSSLHDVELYKPVGKGWRVGEIAALAAPSKPKPSTEPDIFDTAAPATRAAKAAATQPVPSSQPTGPPANAVIVKLSDIQPASAEAVLAPWKQKLLQAGLGLSDADVILSILQKEALDPKRLTVVCRIDARELDQMLPLEVVPQPRRVLRVGLAIVRNIDPAIAGEIDRLIAQLGDADWSRREAATTQLAELGPAARIKLENATKTKDLEIVYRAERLLARLQKPG